MKITVVCNLPPSFGGAETFAQALAVRLREDGTDISIVTHKNLRIQLIDGLAATEYPYQSKHHEEMARKGIRIYPVFQSALCGQSNGNGFHELEHEFISELE